MKKFSKLNESLKVDIDQVNSVLSDLEGFTYDVYDYYLFTDSKGRIELAKDEKDLKPGSYYSNLIVLKTSLSKNSAIVDGWHDDLKFSDSGFYFYDSNIASHFSKVVELLEKFKQHSPKLCMKSEKFLILLKGEKVPDNLLELKEDLSKAYSKLGKLLTELNDKLKATDQNIIQEIYYWREFNKLNIDFYDESNSKYRRNPELLEEKRKSVLASLCTSLQDREGYGWIKNQEKLPEYEEIREEIYDLGFHIKYKDVSRSLGGYMNSSYQLIIYEA